MPEQRGVRVYRFIDAVLAGPWNFCGSDTWDLPEQFEIDGRRRRWVQMVSDVVLYRLADCDKFL